MFFAPAFRPESEITIWGPASPEASLCDRVARYISAPLAPVEVRELPSIVSFREAESHEWEIGPARVSAQAVNHRGPTLGYRIEDGDASLCYIPDHEPGLGAPLAELDDTLDLRIRARPRRVDADPRLPVHRSGVSEPHRLGALAGVRRARVRPPRRRGAAAAVSPRSAPQRRVPRHFRRRDRRRSGRTSAAFPSRSRWRPSVARS